MASYYFPDVRMRLDDGRYFIATKIAGVGYRQSAASRCYEGQKLTLVRDRENLHDKNAIKVLAGGEHVGYIPSDVNEGFATYLDSGRNLNADINKIVGGTEDKPSRGIYINLYLPEDVPIEFNDDYTKSAQYSANVPSHQENFKVNIDGAYKVEFSSRIDYKDRQSSYSASYARLRNGSLIYVAERLKNKWSFGLWNPSFIRTYGSLGECRKEVRRDFKDRLKEDGLDGVSAKNGLYFANMQWSTNYDYRRQVEFRDDMYDRYDTTTEVDLLDYAVYFVFSNVHKYKKILYVVERIGKNWLCDRWAGADFAAGTNLKECQTAIWKHMDTWCKTREYSERLTRYRSLNEG